MSEETKHEKEAKAAAEKVQADEHAKVQKAEHAHVVLAQRVGTLEQRIKSFNTRSGHKI